MKILIRFLNADKAFNGAAVDHDLVVHSLFDLRSRDRHVLQLTEDVRKLHTDELHAFFSNHADDVFLAVPAHEMTLLKIKNRAKRAEFKALSHPIQTPPRSDVGIIALAFFRVNGADANFFVNVFRSLLLSFLT